MSEENVMIEEQDEQEEQVEEQSEAQATPEIEGASKEEVEMAQRHGLLNEEEGENADESDKSDDTNEDKSKETASEKERQEEKDLIGTDDEELASSEIDPEKVKKYSKNETTLYVRQKKAIRAKEALESENQLLKVQLEALKRGGAEQEEEESVDHTDDLDNDNDRILTVGELEKREKERYEKDQAERKAAAEMDARLDSLHKEAQAKYDKQNEEGHFDYVLGLAKEMIKSDKHGVYGRKLFAEAADPDGNAAELVYSIGKLHPDFNVSRKKASKKGDDNLNRIVANASKKTSSATLGGNSDGSTISEDDLTVEDTVNLSATEWGKLKKSTRDRLLRESC